MKKILKIGGFTLLGLAVAGITAFFVWAENPSKPREVALNALKSDDQVLVVETKDYITFEPITMKAETGFIFYPGGHVDFRAYAPILHRIAAEGVFVILVRVKLDLAFFDIDAGARFLDAFPNIKLWTSGGHSLGGVASAMFAAKHPEVKALVFWASYPADNKLVNSGIKMLSIYGSEDGTMDGVKKIEEHKQFQPADTVFYMIQGANHGQFADYGPQPGDRPALISQEEQFEETARVTAGFLKNLR